MQSTEFIWKDGQFIPWAEANVHVLSHGLHYGSGVFEGIRFYQTEKGPAIFKLHEHVARLFYSAACIGMQLSFSESDIAQAIGETVAKNGLEEGYIRPIAFYGYGSMKVLPTAALSVEVYIACWPWGAYLEKNLVDVKTSHIARIARTTTATDAKICGHYVNSIAAGLPLRGTPYHEALLLDIDGNVAEAGSANIFIVKNGALITPPSGGILPGITRNTVIAIAAREGIVVREENFTPETIYDADEAFFTGTAVEVTPIRSLDDRRIGTGECGPVTEKIQSLYQRVVHGTLPEFVSDLTFISAQKEVVA